MNKEQIEQLERKVEEFLTDCANEKNPLRPKRMAECIVDVILKPHLLSSNEGEDWKTETIKKVSWIGESLEEQVRILQSKLSQMTQRCEAAENVLACVEGTEEWKRYFRTWQSLKAETKENVEGKEDELWETVREDMILGNDTEYFKHHYTIKKRV
jgi:hypothetical protein